MTMTSQHYPQLASAYIQPDKDHIPLFSRYKKLYINFIYIQIFVAIAYEESIDDPCNPLKEIHSLCSTTRLC